MADAVDDVSPGGYSIRAERVALALLGVAILIATAVRLLLTADQTFYNDEWFWFSSVANGAPDLFAPANSHLIAVPKLLYLVFGGLFGADYLPFRIASSVAIALCVGLFFALAQRRVGAVAALAPAVVLLFFGTAWNVVLAPIGLPWLCSVAFSLGALLMTERNDRRGDVAAALLLLLAVASLTLGVVFAVAIAVYLLQREDRWRRLWIIAVPLALYAVWWFWPRQFGRSLIDLSNVIEVPLFAAESWGSVLVSLLGLNTTFSAPPSIDQPTEFFWWFAPTIGVLGAVALVLLVRRGGLGPWFLAYSALLVAYWVVLGLSEGPGRTPTTSRYLFPGAVMLLLAAAEAARNVRFRPRSLAVLFLAAAIGVAGNVVHLTNAGRFLDAYSDEARTQLAMLELAGRNGSPMLSLDSLAPVGSRYVKIPSGHYLGIVERWGSPAYSPDEVRAQSEENRAAADFVLARSLGLLAIPVRKAGDAGRCQSEGQMATGILPLSPGTYLLRLSGGGSEPLVLGRFADKPTVGVGNLSRRTQTVLELPHDSSSEPWEAATSVPVEVCAASGATVSDEGPAW